MSEMSLEEVGLDTLVGLSTGRRCSFERSFTESFLLYIVCDSVCTESCNYGF